LRALFQRTISSDHVLKRLGIPGDNLFAVMRQHPFDEIRFGRDDAQCAHQFGLENVFKSAQEAEDFIMKSRRNQASKHPILLILRSSSL
jgi:hypothetical protein